MNHSQVVLGVMLLSCIWLHREAGVGRFVPDASVASGLLTHRDISCYEDDVSLLRVCARVCATAEHSLLYCAFLEHCVPLCVKQMGSLCSALAPSVIFLFKYRDTVRERGAHFLLV